MIKKYVKPSFEIIEFDQLDVVLSSGISDGSTITFNDYGNDWW